METAWASISMEYGYSYNECLGECSRFPHYNLIPYQSKRAWPFSFSLTLEPKLIWHHWMLVDKHPGRDIMQLLHCLSLEIFKIQSGIFSKITLMTFLGFYTSHITIMLSIELSILVSYQIGWCIKLKVYSTPKETHHLYAFTVVKKFNWR